MIRIICTKPPFAKRTGRILPMDFLSWAKADLKGSDKRSVGNAVGNIKKAIHCRLDEIIGHTHATYAGDWNPRCTTETKLAVLKTLGLPYRSVVGLLTDIRNTYEHKYTLPTLKQTRAYYDIAELWLNDPYGQYNIGQIGLVNVPFQGYYVGPSKKGNAFRKFTFDEPSDILYYWNTKCAIVRLAKDGTRTTQAMKSMTWQQILNEERRHIREALRSDEHMIVNATSLTHVFNTYVKWLKMGCPSSRKIDHE